MLKCFYLFKTMRKYYFILLSIFDWKFDIGSLVGGTRDKIEILICKSASFLFFSSSSSHSNSSKTQKLSFEKLFGG